MLLDKISFFEGSTADNLNIISGNTLPTGSIGELFFKTGTDEGLYYHDGIRWLRIGLGSGGGGGSIPSGTDLPTGTTVGQLFIKTGTGANTYIFNGTSWLPLVVELTHEEVDGTLWTWGFNSYGQLGLGNIVSYDKKSSPVLDHVQTSFAEEAAKAAEIDACTTLAQLDAIVLPSNGPVLP